MEGFFEKSFNPCVAQPFLRGNPPQMYFGDLFERETWGEWLYFCGWWAMSVVGRNEGQKDRELTTEEKGEALRKWLDHRLEETGAVAEVDSDFYREFIESSDREMAGMIRLIIYNRVDKIMGSFKKARLTRKSCWKLFQTCCSWSWLDAVFFSEEDSRCCMFKPVGPPTGNRTPFLLPSLLENIKLTFMLY